MTMRNRAIFIDRDGTLCEEMGYINHLSRFRIFPWTFEAIRKVNQSGFKAIVVTNQGGVARGFFPESFVHETHRYLENELKRRGAFLDGIYYCPHHPEGDPPYRNHCRCRKPNTGMIEQAARDHHLDLSQCYVVGDQLVDLQLANNVPIPGVLVKTGFGLGMVAYRLPQVDIRPTAVTENLLEAVHWILSESTR